VQNAEEIAELVRPLDHRMLAVPVRYVASEPATIGDDTDDERQAVIDLMGMTYVSVDELVRQSGSSQANVQMVLLEMELAGKLERGAGGKVRIAA
jgi:DNA processing protein